jgi:four helix bundle protein
MNAEGTIGTGSSRGSRSSDLPAAAERKYDLEERLLEFAAVVIDVSEKLPDTRAGNHLAGQFLRAGTSPYGNHGEAQAPESAEDFIHKMKKCLKELRETLRWARLINHKRWLAGDDQLAFVLRESDELVRIFKASIQTAERNRASNRRGSSSGASSNP